MQKRLLGGLCAGLLCGACAGAETLDEAIARLAKAAAETRDVSIKYTVKGLERMTMRATPFSGTIEFQMLRDGGKALLRVATNVTGEVPAKEEGAPPEKIERKRLTVYDGQFVWTERPRGRSGIRIAYKDLPRDGEGLNLGPLRPIAAAYDPAGLRGHLEPLQRQYDIMVGAKGALAGRPTTVFNLSMNEAAKEKAAETEPEPPVKMVVELDDATGAALAVKFTNGAGEAVLDIAATEVKANTGFDKKLFTYTPPEGMQVRDRTKAPEKSAVPSPPESEKKEQ